MILKFSLESPQLFRDVPIHMYLPDDYLTLRKSYPVLYMFDGHNLFFDEDATFGRSWRLEEHIRRLEDQVIIVGLECSHAGNNRLSEYAPWPFFDLYFGRSFPAYGRETMDFIIDSVKPYIDEHFPTLQDRAHTWIGGSSCGGLMALYALMADSCTFSKAVALSPYIAPSLSSLLYMADTCKPQTPSGLYLSWGAMEDEDSHEFINETCGLVEVVNLLLEKNIQVEMHPSPYGRHCEEDWEKENDRFLEFLFK